MSKIDPLTLHPKYNFQLYNRYFLSKTSWHLTVADFTETWVSENLDNLSANVSILDQIFHYQVH